MPSSSDVVGTSAMVTLDVPPVIGLVVVMALALGGCGTGCENELLNRVQAPDRTKEAVLYVRRCGATTTPGLNVSLVERGDLPGDEPGNVFVIHDPAVGIGASARDVGMRWRNRVTLEISYQNGRRVSRAINSFMGTRVEYVRGAQP